eukprot:7036767-Heterocapsa_arctica.AAC.1
MRLPAVAAGLLASFPGPSWRAAGTGRLQLARSAGVARLLPASRARPWRSSPGWAARSGRLGGARAL